MGLVLSGCAGGTNGFHDLEGKYGNKSDACYAARKPLIDTGSVFAESMIKGAATGAAGGYLAAERQQAANRQELLAAIDADAARDNRQLSAGSNSIADLTRCRQHQVDVVMRQYRAHQIAAADAKAQLVGIRSAVHDDNALIAEVLGEAADRSKTYARARADASNISDSSASTKSSTPSRPAAQPGRYVATANARIRQGPSTSDPVVGHLASGEAVDGGADAGNGWVSVTHNGVTGYVSKSVLSKGTSHQSSAVDKRGGATSPLFDSGTGGTASFAKTNEEAAQRGQEHKQVENDVQTKINDLSAVVS